MPLLPLWSFIKEMFFNKAAATQFARRNQLTVLLLLSNFIMFGLLMFSTEQATRQHAAVVKDIAIIEKLKDAAAANKASAESMQTMSHDLASCENQLTFLASDYREQARALQVCVTTHPKGKK